MRLIHHSSDCDQLTSGDEGSGFRMNVPAEELAQATGFRPGRPARVSGEQWTMENIREPFNGSKEDVYSRYRLARRLERKKRGQGYAEVESGREKGQRRNSSDHGYVASAGSATEGWEDFFEIWSDDDGGESLIGHKI